MRNVLILPAVATLILLPGCRWAEEVRPFDAPQVTDVGIAPPRVIDDAPQAAETAAGVSAEPVYREPVIGGDAGELAVAEADGFRRRQWAEATAGYSNGRVGHMPRWFADPHDDVTAPRPGVFGWGGDDLLAAVYSPARFLVNLVASPVSAVVHPAWERASTDRTPVFVEGDNGAAVESRESGG